MRKIVTIMVAGALAGCGGGMESAAGSRTAARGQLDTLFFTGDPYAAEEADAELALPSIDRSALPAAPWSSELLAADAVPAPILAAWRGSENREQCAPLAPAALGAADGARARAVAMTGGWAVEYDRRGLPGIGRDGNGCDRCGRGVFGIVGTAMSPDEIYDEDGDAPTYSDGSFALLEAGEGEIVAAATLAIPGQSCVYQVWSALGRTHVEELVGAMRFVTPAGDAHRTVASR